MDVAENIAYPLKVKRVSEAASHARAVEAARWLSLERLLERRPGQLSVGSSSAWRWPGSPPAPTSSFDQPLSNLDARLRLEAGTMLKRLQADVGAASAGSL